LKGALWHLPRNGEVKFSSQTTEIVVDYYLVTTGTFKNRLKSALYGHAFLQ